MILFKKDSLTITDSCLILPRGNNGPIGFSGPRDNETIYVHDIDSFEPCLAQWMGEEFDFHRWGTEEYKKYSDADDAYSDNLRETSKEKEFFSKKIKEMQDPFFLL